MSDLFWLTDAQMERLRPFFPESRGKPRVDDRRVPGGITFLGRKGLCWRAAPAAYGPPKTLCNRWFRKALIERAILPCIPGPKPRKVPVEHDDGPYKERCQPENMFGRLEDRRRIATHYDRCADLFLTACCPGAVIPYRL